MEFYEVVRQRRSIRRFTQDEVADDKIMRALDAALLAPNSSNMQAWEFYWVTTKAMKAELATACLGQGAARTAAHLIVAVARTDTWPKMRALMLEHLSKQPTTKKIQTDYYEKYIPKVYFHDPLGVYGLFKWVVMNVTGMFKPFARWPAWKSDLNELVTKSCALACENLMLALTAEGLGSCPMEGFDEARVKKLLGLGSGARVVMVVGTGVIDPKGVYGERVRFDSSLFIKRV